MKSTKLAEVLNNPKLDSSKSYPLKDCCSFRGQMTFWAGTYGLNFYHDFVKLLLKIEKLINFVGIQFFSINVLKQKLCPNKLKTRERGQQKQICKNLNFFFEFFSHRLYFFYMERFCSFYLEFL